MIENLDIAKSLLEQNGEITGLTSGNSMRPLFRSGKDKAIIIPPPENFKVGDVLLYRNKTDDNLVLHRIVKFKKGCPVLRGDSMFLTETGIPHENIVGILKGFCRNGKHYDCQKHIGYKIYVFYIISSYPIRKFSHKVLSALKRFKKTT
ncbi:MAG: hypothetical protein IKT44_03590 [Clostridia bacterium]|nr:hypothetical protein [Clostridia bacterium]